MSTPPSSISGLGVHVLTPLVIDDDGTVLVDRGFVPLGVQARRKRARPGQVEGDVAISGIVRLEGERNMFTPAADEGAAHLVFARHRGHRADLGS